MPTSLPAAGRKSHVLDAYLNTVFYGQQAYGVQAAAETYFSTSATRLTLPQAALSRACRRRRRLRPAPRSAGRPSPPQRGAAGDAVQRLHRRRRLPTGRRRSTRAQTGRDRASSSPNRSSSTTSTSSWSAATARRPSAKAASRSTRLSTGAGNASRARDPQHAQPADRPRSGTRRDRPGHRRDQSDGLGRPGQTELPVQPRRPGKTAGRLELQALRAHRRDPPRHRSLLDHVPVRAVPRPAEQSRT